MLKVPSSEEDEDPEDRPPLLAERKEKDGATVRDFQSLVGSLLWIARRSRPDIAYAVHRATRQSHAPRVADWNLAKRIARYLKGTRDLKLSVKHDEGEHGVARLASYSDADYAGDKDGR